MPLLDVDDIISDLDFLDYDLICERNVQVIGSNGLAVNKTTLLPFAAVVTSGGGDELMREAMGESITQHITIVTIFPLISGATGYTADVVSWNGARYTIIQTDDYSRYGQGFTQAIGQLLPKSGGPPTAAPLRGLPIGSV